MYHTLDQCIHGINVSYTKQMYRSMYSQNKCRIHAANVYIGRMYTWIECILPISYIYGTNRSYSIFTCRMLIDTLYYIIDDALDLFLTHDVNCHKFNIINKISFVYFDRL